MTSTESATHPKLAQIRALLAKAEATNYPHERDAFTAKANELISKFGIDEALLEAESQERSTVSHRTILIEGPYAMDKRHLLHSVYTPLGTKNVDTGKNRAGSVHVHVFGYDSDLDRAELLYTSLLIQALRGMEVEAIKGWSGRETMANKRAWLHGFRTSVYGRILEAERRAQGDAQQSASTGVSTELVLRDRGVAVAQAYDEWVGDRAGTFKKRAVNISGRGYNNGHAAGNRADIGGKRVGGQRTAIG